MAYGNGLAFLFVLGMVLRDLLQFHARSSFSSSNSYTYTPFVVNAAPNQQSPPKSNMRTFKFGSKNEVEWPPFSHQKLPVTDLPPSDWSEFIVLPAPAADKQPPFTDRFPIKLTPSMLPKPNYSINGESTKNKDDDDVTKQFFVKSLANEDSYRKPYLPTARSEEVFSDHINCYSCMSQFYKANWGLLQNLYHKPLNFTDECNFDPTKENAQKNVGLVPCNSVCIKMFEQSQIGGLYVNGFTRGCYDHLLRRGFNATLVRWYRWLQRDSCHEYSRKEVLQLGQNAPDGVVTICTCYADGCNGAPRLSAAATEWMPLLRWSTYLIIAFYLSL